MIENIPMLPHFSIEQIANDQQDMLAELRELHPIKTAATFGGLLAMPEIQANCLRLEVLVHLAIAYGQGSGTPSKGFAQRAFEKMGNGFCGLAEDPTEDVFAALVNTPRGNFRIFEGLREGTAFHLQRILNVAERMPAAPPYNRIRRSVDALLRLSDSVAERAGVRENVLGQERPLSEIPPRLAGRLSHARDLVRFNEDDLGRLGMRREILAPFVLDAGQWPGINSQMLGHTDLERRPIAFLGDSIFLLLPTAVATAVTRFVIETIMATGQTAVLENALAGEFSKLFWDTPILGVQASTAIPFSKIEGGWFGSVITEADPGRLLHLAFFVDGLSGYEDRGLGGTTGAPESVESAIRVDIEQAIARASAQPDFRSGVSLLVLCGFGRGISLQLEANLPENWRFESIAAYDLITLSWVHEFNQLSLLRILDARQILESHGTDLFNVNGLLNLVAWAQQNEGHLVPHRDLPDGFAAPGKHSLVVVAQNALRDLRHRVLTEWNPRRVLDLGGNWVAVRKLGNSYFEEESAAPLYVSEEDIVEHRLRGVYVARRRPWWIEIIAPADSSSH